MSDPLANRTADPATWLSPPVAERTRALSARPPRPDGEIVIYWMQATWRGHDNPALDAALLVATALGLPVVVVMEILSSDPYASDRKLTFALEGARDAARELKARGVPVLLNVDRSAHNGSAIGVLAQRAAVVVTDDMPVRPWRDRTQRLADEAGCAVWAADGACVVPMRLIGRAHDRAFQFRAKTQALRQARVGVAWSDAPAPAAGPPPVLLTFDPVDPETMDIPALIAACDVDHAIAPVPLTPGGSVAGYARWREFRDLRLAAYARRRNDALDGEGVSRLSAYLHMGHVSPFRIAREAWERGGAGVEKFLDELLVWREMSWAWCFYRADHDTIDALPGWARQTLDCHRNDRRLALHSLETMARARTGDVLWDAAQRSLVSHGELHNNVRMTWGKALLEWTDGPEQCLERLIELNHRYALDGEDPNSYGGLFWCLGLFDRPFTPEAPIVGSVRSRSTAQHARRLDIAAYARHTGRAAHADPPRVAVIGAGLAGMSCARTLIDHGWPVSVFEKGRRPGGRISTRRDETGAFDHGAQYFTVKDRRFARLVESWRHDGIVAPWTAPLVRLAEGVAQSVEDGRTRYVGVPGMSAIGRHLAADLSVRDGVRIDRLERRDGGWWTVAEGGAVFGPFDRVIVEVPAPQAVRLLAPSSDLAAAAAAAEMAPCWAVMLAFARHLPLAFGGAFVDDPVLSWIARDSDKPGRPAGERWVLHATSAWTRDHMDDDPAAVVDTLIAAFARAAGIDPGAPLSARAHRWLYAQAGHGIGSPCLFDAPTGLGACGDWCVGGRIEGAFLSGAAMAGRLFGAVPVLVSAAEAA
jgi:photolyase PhrII